MTAPLHEWETTGVTAYPITHPIVGQSDFYAKFKSYLDLVGRESNRFAQVFAVVAPWGVGKSRIGYEIVAQINGTSKGWKVRAAGGGLEEARIFDDENTREKYLALYLRYSQVAHPRLNLDNWFAPAVYKALTPLARATFDTSIQHQIARQGYVRLNTLGFDPAALAAAMELGTHSEEEIYGDTALATRLCNAAFAALKPYGIEYVVVVLDELETASERATAGMESEEARTLDGKAITMLRRAVEIERRDIEAMSRAVKEEDARARFPWLRFVVLCSSAIGDELKEVQSTNRRFEIVDLASNAFSDVSTFVHSLEAEGRLFRPYPKGLVEAAYMMSGGNFGWFNVVMAVVDQVLQKGAPGMPLEDVFERAISVSSRIGSYVLDRRALDELPGDPPFRRGVARIAFGQQPLPLVDTPESTALLIARNAHGEPVAIRFHRVSWRLSDCTRVLVQNRFNRLPGTGKWSAPGIPEPIDLERLLDDLATLAVHEAKADPETFNLLLPSTQADFLQLLDLIHPHPAAEETGRVLWAGLVGGGSLPDAAATHIGPSVELLRRLDIRLRKASVGAVFRDPDENNAFNVVLERQKASEKERHAQILVGALRLLDEHWTYDSEPAGLGADLLAIRTPKDKGLVDFKGLWLHPKGQAVLAWVSGDTQLLALARTVATHQKTEGRYPVLALTSDYDLPERFSSSTQPEFVRARDCLVVVHLNSGEESALHSIGLPVAGWVGYRLRRDGFTTRFGERLNRIKGPIARQVQEWRHQVGQRGGIAWPIRPSGPLKEDSLKRVLRAWQIMLLEKGGVSLQDAGAAKGFDFEILLSDLDKLGLSPAAAPKGYTQGDRAGLWVGEGPAAHPEVPSFLLRLVLHLFDNPDRDLDLDDVKADWLWGYTWDGSKPGDIFREWMRVACESGWARAQEEGAKKKTAYRLVSRTAYKGALDAARNWLDVKYPAIYNAIHVVLGPGALDQYFKPGGGSKYAKAQKQLAEAESALRSLEALEATPPSAGDLAAAKGWFIEVTRLRLRIQDLTAQVFDKEKYEALPADLEGRMLDLLDEDRPLWERIRQAEHFANAVQDIARRIRKRLPSLGDELRAGVAEIVSFPIQLFTRPLSKIEHIVDTGLTGDDPSTTTQRAQHAKVETLAWYLKELRVAAAMGSLRGLARELGVGETPANDVAFDAIEGDIVEGWRDLRKRYGGARTALRELSVRIQWLDIALVDAPSSFRLPPGASLEEVRDYPGIIEAHLDQSLNEDIEDLLERHDDEMTIGMFAPLMREARSRLLETAEQKIRGLEGKVRTIENAVQHWRKGLLENAVLLRARRSLNALRRAQGQKDTPMPTIAELEALSLKEGAEHVASVVAGWALQGTGLLQGTSVSFAEWQEAVDAIAAEKEPPLSPNQADALVERGFLRRVYAIPGGLA